jgi:hypothetical protein
MLWYRYGIVPYVPTSPVSLPPSVSLSYLSVCTDLLVPHGRQVVDLMRLPLRHRRHADSRPSNQRLKFRLVRRASTCRDKAPHERLSRTVTVQSRE